MCTFWTVLFLVQKGVYTLEKFVEFTVENNNSVWYHSHGFKKAGTYRNVHIPVNQPAYNNLAFS